MEEKKIDMFKRSILAEKLDLDKLGWSECKNDKQILSYIRGYVWRNYKVRIKPPLDWIMFCLIDDSLIAGGGKRTRNATIDEAEQIVKKRIEELEKATKLYAKHEKDKSKIHKMEDDVNLITHNLWGLIGELKRGSD